MRVRWGVIGALSALAIVVMWTMSPHYCGSRELAGNVQDCPRCASLPLQLENFDPEDPLPEPLPRSPQSLADTEYLFKKWRYTSATLKQIILRSKMNAEVAVTLPATPRSASQSALSIVTINMWGVKNNWEDRRRNLATLLSPRSPTILCLQEVFLPMNATISTAHQLANELKIQYTSFFPLRTEKDAGQEGLAVVSQYPIKSSELILLEGGPKSSDPNQRATLHAVIELPGARQCHVFVVHLTYDATSQCTMVLNLIAAVQSRVGPSDCVFLAGDFNA